MMNFRDELVEVKGYDNWSNEHPVDGAKKVWVSTNDSGMTPNTGGFGSFGNTMDFSKREPIAFLANKDNLAVGWSVFPLDKGDIDYLRASKMSTANVYRLASDKGTTLAKLNLKTARMFWGDDNATADSDKMTFEKRAVTWDRLIIPNKHHKVFGIKKGKSGGANYEF